MWSLTTFLSMLLSGNIYISNEAWWVILVLIGRVDSRDTEIDVGGEGGGVFENLWRWRWQNPPAKSQAGLRLCWPATRFVEEDSNCSSEADVYVAKCAPHKLSAVWKGGCSTAQRCINCYSSWTVTTVGLRTMRDCAKLPCSMTVIWFSRPGDHEKALDILVRRVLLIWYTLHKTAWLPSIEVYSLQKFLNQEIWFQLHICFLNALHWTDVTNV